MAPTKALCSERQADWGVRFARLGLTCGELTGDTAIEHQDAVKRSDIIITTPEKWDSVSRRWQDSSSLVRMVRLFLVDEVHMLRDERGAILEVVVSRMKQATDSCRIAALSATVPNIEDVAAWLGFSSLKPSVPARILKFDDSFRPVALRKEVIGYRVNNMNSFQFSSHLTRYVTDLIAKFSSGRPTIVFCSTRKDALTTANRLIEDFEASKATLWPLPAVDFTVTDKALAKLLLKGVAIHHAGLSHRDRVIVENGFLGGHLQIICCTSTLAVGINLPAHLVILKGTRQYIGGSMVEYSDLDILQMVGRAGRPQFDDFGVAVIMTDAQHVDRYRALVTGEDLLESQLHLQLIEHLNAEIVQGTIKSVPQAMRWLKGTFLYVRMQKNPEHYTIADKVLGSDEALGEICRSALDSLETTGLITVAGEQVSPTSHGRTMANGYVRFNTMRQLLSLPRQASLETIVR
ncbi:ATP-dependent DNA helicase MER3 [Savitreella phatthalungensis]